MNRKPIAALLAALCLIPLAGCGEGHPPGGAEAPPGAVEPSTKLTKPPQPEQILSDVNRSKGQDATFTACEVIKRQSNTEDKEDIVYCRLTAESGMLRAERQYKLLYNFYDEGGWILDEITPENEDQWTATHLDAAGNDILKDMVWLDSFSVDQLANAHYLCEYDGTHYLMVPDGPSVQSIYWVRDHNGKRVSAHGFEDPSSVHFVFPGEDGKPRFIFKNEGNYELIDENDTPLSQAYDWIRIKDKATGLCIVRQDGLYGAIDENGALVVPCQYEDVNEVIPGVLITPPAGYVETERPDLPPGVNMYNNNANGMFDLEIFDHQSTDGAFHHEVIDGNGDPLIAIDYEETAYDSHTGLIMVIPNTVFGNPQYSYRLYDLNGNCRSPEFVHIGNSIYSAEIVGYQGRYGILPQILSDEEKTYFRYQWGMDHKNGG